jgi:hypothetical protein
VAVNRRLTIVMVFVVLAIWLVGAAVTRYTLEEMAYFAPIAVLVIGATIGLGMIWVKVIRDSLRQRRQRPTETP